MIVSVFITGCGKREKKNNKTVNLPVENTQSNDNNASVPTPSSDIPISDEIATAAKEEGVSTSEMQKIIDELSQMEADKYQITLKKYLSDIESAGDTAYSVQKLLADTLGMTIIELYDYQVANKKPLTEEQKENNANMANAFEEIKNVDLSDANVDVEAMLGIHDNDTGEIREVAGDAKEMLSYKVEIIVDGYEDEYSIVVQYNSSEDVDALVEYFDNLLKNTNEYMLLTPPNGFGGQVQGTIDGYLVTVSIEESSGSALVDFYIDTTTK